MKCKNINRAGETNINSQGLKMTIIKYNRSSDIDVEFEDGYISKNKRYDNFLKGMIENKNFPRSNKGKENKYKGVIKTDRTNEKRTNNQGLNMEIIEYKSCMECLILFEDGYKVIGTYDSFKKGNVRNPNYKKPYIKTRTNLVYGVGISDLPSIDENGKTLNSYSKWIRMIERCYSEKYHQKYPNYIGCEVCDEWKLYSNFKKWYDDNFYEVDNEIMHLDKDILFKNNKVYSSNTCIFVPQKINCLFAYRKKTTKNIRGVECTGIKYRVRVYDDKNNPINLGLYDTEEEAFNVYKTYKEEYIKKVADEYKDKIPKKLYEAMYLWTVEMYE